MYLPFLQRDLKKMSKNAPNATVMATILLDALFSPDESNTCSVMGQHTNKTYDQKPALNRKRREVLENKLYLRKHHARTRPF